MPRLPRGMYKRGPCFYARLYAGGKEQRKSLGRDFSKAVEKLHKLRAGVAIEEDSGRVAELGEQWITSYVATARNPKNATLTAMRFRRYIGRYIGHMQADQVSADDLRHYRVWLERKGLAPMSVKHLLSDARCFFGWLEDSGRLDKSPFPRRLMPKIQELPPQGFTDEESRTLRALAEPHGFYLRFLLGTGLRWGEAIKARADHVDGGMLTVAAPKTKKVRRVPLEPELLREVRTRIGQLIPLSEPGSFNRMIRKHSGIESFHVHRTRHAYAINWLRRGGNLKTLSLAMGHGSVAVTERYAKLTDEDVYQEAMRLAAVSGAQSDQRPDHKPDQLVLAAHPPNCLTH